MCISVSTLLTYTFFYYKLLASFSAIGNAINLASSLCKFPQECLRADRLSAYHSTYNSSSLEEALKFESENSAHVLAKESVKGIISYCISF